MGRTLTWRSSSRFVTEEVANQWTHAIGFLLSLPAGWILLAAAAERSNPWLSSGCAIYVASLSAMYAASTLSHSVHRGLWRHRFRSLDQVCIFLLIAGNYTAFGMTFLRDGWWGVLLIVMWLLALIGIVLKLFFTKFDNVSVWFYLLTGWVGIIAIPQYFHFLGTDGVLWIAAGALAYSGGTWFLTRDERRLFYHPLWHVMVMIGTACHYVVVLKYVVPGG